MNTTLLNASVMNGKFIHVTTFFYIQKRFKNLSILKVSCISLIHSKWDTSTQILLKGEL